MGAAAIPIAMGVGSFAAAKMGGADTKTALGAGLLGGVGGWAAGPALGLAGSSGALSAGMMGTQIGGMFGGGGSSGGGATVNPLGAAGGTAASSGAPSMVSAAVGNPFDAYGPKGQFAYDSATGKPPLTADKASKGIQSLSSAYAAKRADELAEEEAKREQLKAEAYAQNAAYRPAPSPSFAPSLGSFPGVSGGFALGR